MSTIVFVHAHPDDEASQTSGSMARLAAEGHRVVCVYATNGDHGEPAPDLGDDTVAAYRRREAAASNEVIGTARVAWLGYADSGMTGWDANEDPDSFHLADLAEAATRLAAVLDEEDADAVVGYDWHGGYGHPDHVKLHHVVRRACEVARRRPRYLEETANRDAMERLFAQAIASGALPAPEGDEGFSTDDGNPFGEPESAIHYRVDVRPWLSVKRAALSCHASQTSDVGFMLALPPEVFEAWFGWEYFIEPGQEPGMRDAWPF